MVADRTRELLFPITILASVAVGVVIGSVFGRTSNADHAQIGTSSSDSKAIVDAIDAVRAELVRMHQRLDASSMSLAQPEQRDMRSIAAPDASAEIHKATAALVQAADFLRTASIRGEGTNAALIAPAVVDPVVWTDLDKRTFAENLKTYILWNYQQVMERFGQPDMYGKDEGGTYWAYRRGEMGQTLFRFVDGRVAAVQTNP